jgi:GGDEF domain-containing protein
MFTRLCSWLMLLGWTQTQSNSLNLATALSFMSVLTLVVLALVSYSRLKLDDRLLQLVDETRRLAEEDALTGLMNRRAFIDQLNSAWLSKEEFVVGLH